jgi:hypothetical protein
LYEIFLAYTVSGERVYEHKYTDRIGAFIGECPTQNKYGVLGDTRPLLDAS